MPSSDAFYKVIGIASIVALVLDIPLLLIFGPGPGDAMVIVAAILGIIAWVLENKGLVIGSMVCSIIAVILLGFFLMTALLGAALCGIVDGVGDALCQSEQEFRTQSTMAEGADPTCCFQCPGIMSTCEGKGCLYYPIEAWQECNVVCTTERDCSNSVTGCTDTSSDCKSTLGSLSTRFSDTSITLADCTGFENNADVASTSWDAQSNPAHCGKPSGLVATDTPSVAEQAAVGCTDDEHATETDTACTHVYSGAALGFLVLALLLASSIAGCCVACCGKGPSDDDKEDSG